MNNTLPESNTINTKNNVNNGLFIFQKIKKYINQILSEESIESKVLSTQEKLINYIINRPYQKDNSNLIPQELNDICQTEKYIIESWIYLSKINIPYSSLSQISLNTLTPLNQNSYYSLDTFSIKFEINEKELWAIYNNSTSLIKYQFNENKDKVYGPLRNQLLWIKKDNVIYNIHKSWIISDIRCTLFFLVKECNVWTKNAYDGLNFRPVVAWWNINDLYNSNENLLT